MSKPIVAVVGRPNVGKSTLFNKLCGQRLAIKVSLLNVRRVSLYSSKMRRVTSTRKTIHTPWYNRWS